MNLQTRQLGLGIRCGCFGGFFVFFFLHRDACARITKSRAKIKNLPLHEVKKKQA